MTANEQVCIYCGRVGVRNFNYVSGSSASEYQFCCSSRRACQRRQDATPLFVDSEAAGILLRILDGDV